MRRCSVMSTEMPSTKSWPLGARSGRLRVSNQPTVPIRLG